MADVPGVFTWKVCWLAAVVEGDLPSHPERSGQKLKQERLGRVETSVREEPDATMMALNLDLNHPISESHVS